MISKGQWYLWKTYKQKLRSHSKMSYILVFPKLDIQNNEQSSKKVPSPTKKLGMKHVIITVFTGTLQRTNIFNNKKVMTET